MLDPAIFHQAYYLTGPTAVGKSAVGIELARRIGAEIISLDSMALYRGMDIGTAKPSASQRATVPHHLVDLIDPYQDFSVADYLAAATQAVADIRARGAIPLFVGGTPLYLKALLRGLCSGPPADWELRHALEARAAAEGRQRLHAELAAVDPVSAARLHANDVRRVIRALEVYHLTGLPLSGRQQEFDQPAEGVRGRACVLSLDRAALRQRIERRVEAMFAAGWIEEVRKLAAQAAQQAPLSRTALQAVGYREILEHLAGARGLAETQSLVALRTWRFARRQATWFRSLAELEPITLAADESPAAAAERVGRAFVPTRV